MIQKFPVYRNSSLNIKQNGNYVRIIYCKSCLCDLKLASIVFLVLNQNFLVQKLSKCMNELNLLFGVSR